MKKKTKRYTTILLLTLSIILLFAVFYYIANNNGNYQSRNKNSVQTYEWKTYKNGSITISYPSSWTYDPSLKGLNHVQGNEGFVIISPEYQHNSGGYLEKGSIIRLFVGRTPFSGNMGLVSQEKTTWKGQDAVLATYEYEGKSLVLTTKLQTVDYQLVMSYSVDGEREKNRELFLKIAESITVD